jgi:hypothetical protein
MMLYMEASVVAGTLLHIYDRNRKGSALHEHLLDKQELCAAIFMPYFIATQT